MEQAKLAEKPSLNLRRHYPVAPEKDWRAWTDAEALKQWWGPGGPEAVSLVQLDVRVGGRFRIVFGGARGDEHEVQGIYKEVVPNRRLAFTWSWRDGAAQDEAMITVQFAPVAGGTEQVFTLDPVVDPRERDAWRADFKRLGLLLEEK